MDQDRNAMEDASIPVPTTPSTREVVHLPASWIELRSIAESVSDKSDEDTVTMCTAPSTMRSNFPGSEHPESTANLDAPGHEKQVYSINHPQKPAQFSTEGMSILSKTEPDPVYPSTPRVLLITLSLAISIFVVALDRTVIATATYELVTHL